MGLLELEPCHDPGEHLKLVVRPDLPAGDKPGINVISALPTTPWDEFFQLNHHLFEGILYYPKKAPAGLALLICLKGFRAPDLVEKFEHVIANLACCKHLYIILKSV
jgi:hypothetical protein